MGIAVSIEDRHQAQIHFVGEANPVGIGNHPHGF